MNSEKISSLAQNERDVLEEERVVVFEGDASIRGLLRVLEEKGVTGHQELRAEAFDSAVLDLRFRKPYSDAMQMTVKTVSGNAAERILWVAVEVAAQPGTRLVDSQEMFQDRPVLEFGEFWGRVSQVRNYRAALTLENVHAC